MDYYYEQIVDLIDPDHGLLQQLLTTRCISSEQKADIESASSSRQRSSRIIECVRQKDEFYLVSLVDCLKRTKQQRLSLLFTHAAGKIITLTRLYSFLREVTVRSTLCTVCLRNRLQGARWTDID